jgi:Tol biopolymer transport system component
MGEVWRARDTRLDREVAIKVLPPALAQNAAFKLRFEREAKTISQLSHPNICTLYDVGENYLVMELLDGQNLADRIGQGPLPLAEVFTYGIQIAEALDKAHRAGVVHRDLKPGNVMLTKSGAKLLDFGLAKSTTGVGFATVDGPTEHRPLTQEGTILGTLQYMAPEQLEGLEADARTDIFAFGALLYEMVTGNRAFQGKSKTSLIAAIVSAEPKPVSSVQPLASPALEHVIDKCLAKERDDRWQSAHDIAQELRWVGSTAHASVRKTRATAGTVAIVAGAVLLAALLGGAAVRAFAHPDQPHAVRFTIPTRDGAYHAAWIAAPSPDGTRLVFGAANPDGVQQLWTRNVDSLDAQPIAGTEGMGDNAPLFGTSSKSVLFMMRGHLKNLDLDNRTVEDVAAIGGRFYGSSINDDGTILYSSDNVVMTKRAGAAPVALTHLDRGAGEVSHRWPTFLPDGKRFLFVSRGAANAQRPGVLYLASIDSAKRTAVTDSMFRAVYAGGFLFLPRDKKLMAFPFDPNHATITGSGRVVAEKINSFIETGWAAFHVTEGGLLTYRIRTDESRLIWLDANGRAAGSIGGVADYESISISPDGKRVAASVIDPEKETSDLWVYGIDRPTAERVTNDPGLERSPVWSHDGRRIAYTSDDASASGVVSLKVHALAGGGPDAVLMAGRRLWPCRWSADDKELFYISTADGQQRVVFGVGTDGLHPNTIVSRTPFEWTSANPSPDGRLLLFSSSDSGKEQVYVQPMSGGEEKAQVSTEGGDLPSWSTDQKHIYFINKQDFMVADITSDGGIHVSEPRRLFELSFSPSDGSVAPDGRFLFIAPVERSEWAPTAVIVNWKQAVNGAR